MLIRHGCLEAEGQAAGEMVIYRVLAEAGQTHTPGTSCIFKLTGFLLKGTAASPWKSGLLVGDGIWAPGGPLQLEKHIHAEAQQADETSAAGLRPNMGREATSWAPS